MILLRATLIVCSLWLVGCFPATTSLVLRSDVRNLGGGETRAQIDVPGTWLQLANEALGFARQGR